MNLLRREPVAEAERTLWRGGWLGDTGILAYLATFNLLVHLLTNGNYGQYIYVAPEKDLVIVRARQGGGRARIRLLDLS